MPAPLDAKRHLVASFGVGLVLVPADGAGGLGRIEVRFVPEAASADAGAPCQPALRALARGNPAAQSLRLLESLARRAADRHALAYLDGRLDVAVAR
jgi:hypothetical protein